MSVSQLARSIKASPTLKLNETGQLIKHLGENWCIIEMVVTGKWPFSSTEEMAEGMKLENIPACSRPEAMAALQKDLDDAVAYLEKEIDEQEFFSKVVSAPWGFRGEIWKGVLMAKDHQMNHKMHLHIYLKLLGLPVNTGTLYGM